MEKGTFIVSLHREPLANRFNRKVKVIAVTDCWEWFGNRFTNGYGQINVGNRMLLAHRVAWELKVGPIGRGLRVLHRCDNRACVNPSHLFLGSQSDNIRDMDIKGRRKPNPRRGEKHANSKLTNEAVLYIRLHYKRGDLQFGGGALSKKFGVSAPLVNMIARREIWKHI